jgi:LPXTG-motif cell wall-anchored protein
VPTNPTVTIPPVSTSTVPTTADTLPFTGPEAMVPLGLTGLAMVGGGVALLRGWRRDD